MDTNFSAKFYFIFFFLQLFFGSMILPYQSFFIIVQIVYWRNANVDKLTLGWCKKRPQIF